MLDIESIIADGWRPTPFRQFLLKLHSRCNLACDYCYVYTKADQNWRQQPRKMSTELLTRTVQRIAEHARIHDLDTVHVVLHGGEPLLAGKAYLARTLTHLRRVLEPVAQVRIGLQTNGVLLDQEFVQIFAEQDVRLGVSVDGNAAAHDRHRRYRDGLGSYAKVSRALRLLALPEFRSVYGGLLCTVDLDNDPVEVYDGLLPFSPPKVDFLLPHGTWSTPPRGKDVLSPYTPYGDWLIAVFDRWYDSASTAPAVRLFEEIIHLLLGGMSGTEAVGLTPSSLIVIETDGSIEQGDSLKVAFDQAPRTGLHVTTDSFAAALRLPSIVARQLGAQALADDCAACSLQRICGGGLYAHRYKTGSGFRNPSVYCSDLFRLISHIRERVRAGLARLSGADR